MSGMAVVTMVWIELFQEEREGDDQRDQQPQACGCA